MLRRILNFKGTGRTVRILLKFLYNTMYSADDFIDSKRTVQTVENNIKDRRGILAVDKCKKKKQYAAIPGKIELCISMENLNF